MAKGPKLMTDKSWTKASAARQIIECQKQLLEVQSTYFSLIGTLKEGEYNKAIKVIKGGISELKNQELLLQALLLEFDGGIPVANDDIQEALQKLKNAIKKEED